MQNDGRDEDEEGERAKERHIANGWSRRTLVQPRTKLIYPKATEAATTLSKTGAVSRKPKDEQECGVATMRLFA